MAAVAAFRQALVRCGLTQASADIVIAEGFSDIDTFSTISHSILDDMLGNLRKGDQRAHEGVMAAAVAAGNPAPNYVPIFPFFAQINMHGMLMWCQQKRRMNQTINAAEFNDAVRASWTAQYSAGKEEPLQDLVSKPSKFKSTTIWHEWNDKLVLYLDSLTAFNCRAPLSYVIRADPNPPAANFEFASDIERAVLTTPHAGEQYTKDKANVYNILREATMGEASDSVVFAFQRSRDGRAAYIALKTQSEGGADVSITISECYKIIDELKYRGELPSFGVRDLHSRMRKAFTRLTEQGVDLPEKDKVRRLKKAYADNLHVQVVAAITTLGANPALNDTFDHASDYLQQQMLNINWGKKSVARAISGVGSGETVSDGKPRLEVKNYSPQEFGTFSAAQKKQLKQDRIDQKKNGGKKISKRQIKSLEKTNKKLKKRVEELEGQGGGAEDANNNGDGAGGTGGAPASAGSTIARG